jgi:oxazoline/thiazoline synthase
MSAEEQNDRIITDLIELPHLAPNIHIFKSRHKWPPGNAFFNQKVSREAICGGCGATRSEAENKAIFEAFERYSGLYHGDEPTLCASQKKLGPTAISPNHCLLYSERQLSHSNMAGFDGNTVLAWTQLTRLSNQQTYYLPTSICYYGYQGFARELTFPADSIGNSAAATLTKAVRGGLLEVIERDAVALWWYTKTQRPRVRETVSECPYLQEMMEVQRKFGRELTFLNLTTDLDIPCCASISYQILEDANRGKGICFGFGAATDQQVAATKAVKEMNLMFRDYLLRDLIGVRALTLKQWWRTVDVRSEPWLLPSSDGNTDLAPRLSPIDASASVDQLIDHLERAGFQVLMVKQTRSPWEVPSVKIFVPGLRPPWPRFGPGRLFHVPVEMGWCPQPQEDSFNAKAFFF